MIKQVCYLIRLSLHAFIISKHIKLWFVVGLKKTQLDILTQ